MAQPEGPGHRGGRPSVADWVFEGEATPLLLRRSVVAAVVAAFLLAAGGYVGISEWLGISYTIHAEPFQAWVEDRGPLGPVVFILVMALSVLFAPIPNVPIFIAAGLAWGSVVGTIYSMIGMMLGSVLAFYCSRLLGRKHLPRLIGGRAAGRLDLLVDKMGGRVIFWARMLPVVNFDWISFLAGLTSIRFWPFFVASFLGMLLPTTVAVVAGDALGKDIRITFALAGLWVFGIVVSAAFFWYRRRQAQRARLLRGSADPGGETTPEAASG